MSRKPIFLIPAIALLAAGVLVSFTLFVPRDNGPGDQLVFPIVWTPATPESGVAWLDSRIEIDADSSGEVRDLLVGQVSNSEDGVECVELSGELYSGPVTWSMSHGKILVDADAHQALFFPLTGPGDGVDWGSMREVLCDGSNVDYAARTANR